MLEIWCVKWASMYLYMCTYVYIIQSYLYDKYCIASFSRTGSYLL